jgi:hypothetical protein
MRPTKCEGPDTAKRLEPPEGSLLASRGPSASTHPKITQLNAARDRRDVWIALLTLLDRLRARVGNALEDFESELIYDERLAAELKDEVETFSRFAADAHRRRQP